LSVLRTFCGLAADQIACVVGGSPNTCTPSSRPRRHARRQFPKVEAMIRDDEDDLALTGFPVAHWKKI
jgi:hypothetical protein